MLRALDLGLAEIAAILDQQQDELPALRDHYQRVLGERSRLDQVAAMIARTIAELETRQGDTGMPTINRPENLFEGFDPTDYDAESRERWPAEWEQSQQEMQLAYEGVCRFWTPNAQAFKGLGQMYVDDPRFTATYDAVTPGLPAYYRDAMAVYADSQLA